MAGIQQSGDSSPPYPDILAQSADGSTHQSYELKYDVLTKRWVEVHNYKFPARYIGSSKRKLQPHVFVKNTWLNYSKSTDSIYCGPCRFFGPQSSDSRDKAFGTSPVTDWSNLTKLVTRHEATKSHQSSLLSTEEFLKIAKGKSHDVMTKMHEGHETAVAKNREILKCIIDTVILCGNQGIALRGHSDEAGNFVQLLKYRSKDNALLREHLSKTTAKHKYTSPDVQNELIDICGDIIVDDIVAACNRSPCFALIADEATDYSTMEQMALCVRFYDADKKTVREEFLGFSECHSTTGEALTDSFLTRLLEKGVDINRIRGQGYDGAANMSGKFRGVQARVREVIPGAIYTHCKAHNLNLCIIHACKEPLVRNVMDTIQAIAFAFDYSAKRLVAYTEALEGDERSRNEMENRHKLKTLCEARWAARAEALSTFKAAFTTVYSALGTLADDGDGKASMYQGAISKFSFIIALVATEHVLSGLVNLSSFLQKKECDLLAAVQHAKEVKRVLDAERNDPLVWEALYEVACDLAQLIDVQPAMPRVAQAQRHRPNIAAPDIATYWKQNLYLPFVDHLMSEIDIRILQAQPRYSAEKLLPRVVSNITVNEVDAIYDAYSADLTESRISFHREVKRWQIRWNDVTDTDAPSTLQDTLGETHPDLYPSIFMVLCVFISMPVSTATAERSFSVMRRVKTYLRNTMTTNRLSGLGLLNVYREKELSSDVVLDIFTRRKNRKLALIFE